MCTHIPNNEGYHSLHIGNINPMVTIKILEQPKIYIDQRRDIEHQKIPYLTVELVSIDKYTEHSKGWKNLIGKKVILPLLKTVYISIIENLKEKNITIDNDLKCIVNKVFRIHYIYRKGYKTELVDENKSIIKQELVPYVSNVWKKDKKEVFTEDEIEKILETLPIYDVNETGIGHWAECSEETHNREIDIYSASEILERIGIDIECSEFEGDYEYYMIYDYTQEQGIPGLYIPRITYEYIINHIKPQLKDK